MILVCFHTQDEKQVRAVVKVAGKDNKERRAGKVLATRAPSHEIAGVPKEFQDDLEVPWEGRRVGGVVVETWRRLVLSVYTR